ncbi:MAG: tetraacyldisaccharide 4'-kinase [Nitrospirota bacterium]
MKKVLYSNEKELFWNILLSPLFLLSLIYLRLLHLRLFLYRRGIFFKTKELRSKVLSVGNLTLGGTGKTPIVIYLAEQLHNKGKRVGIISRGYKGKEKRVVLISDGKGVLSDPSSAGEEPYLIAARVKDIAVATGSDRFMAGNLIIKEADSDIIIMDDGFQHISLNRDIDILLIDATNPFGNGYLIPRGILREPLSCIKRASAIMITRMDSINNERVLKSIIRDIKRYNKSAPIFKIWFRPAKLINLVTNKERGIELLKGKSIIAVSGIGNPEAFISGLVKSGVSQVFDMTYPDHYIYKRVDINDIKEVAGRQSVDLIITTEKDAVKIKELLSPDIDNFFALRIDIDRIEDNKAWEGYLSYIICSS